MIELLQLKSKAFDKIESKLLEIKKAYPIKFELNTAYYELEIELCYDVLNDKFVTSTIIHESNKGLLVSKTELYPVEYDLSLQEFFNLKDWNTREARIKKIDK
jgi:hypothetical protein